MAQSGEAPKIIFSMLGVSKKIERKEILRDISLSFFYGAKIGVLGLNGSGKSSLMRLLAGIDKEFEGHVAFEPGYSVGFLPQEPSLTPGAAVRACVEEGVRHLTELTAAYDATWDELSAAADDAAREAISDRQVKLQEQIDALGAWDTAPMVEQAGDRRSAVGLFAEQRIGVEVTQDHERGVARQDASTAGIVDDVVGGGARDAGRVR